MSVMHAAAGGHAVTGVPWGAIGTSVGWAGLCCLVWALTGFTLARLLHRNNIVDTMWGLGPALIAVITAVAAISAGDGDGLRQALLLVCALAWGLRLSWHVGRRSAGKGEDPRYAELMAKGKGSPLVRSITVIFVPQAVILLVISLPVEFGMAERGPVGLIGWIGVAVWLTGFLFETVGDAQMERFKADPENKGKIADTGLWRWTRHPNYFGDAAVWTGIFLITAGAWPGLLTIVSPVVMTYTLTQGTGKRLLERSMSKRPGYAEYMQRTSAFFPLPPGFKKVFSR